MGLPSLVSVEELKVFISVKEDVTAFDEQLISLAKSATKLLETFCRREFTAKDYTEQFDTVGNSSLEYDLGGGYQNDLGVQEKKAAQRFSLKGMPVDPNDFALFYDPSRAFGEDTQLAAAEYYLKPDTNSVYVFRSLADTKGGMKAIYSAGYASETEGSGDDAYELISGAPEDLKMACITQVIFLFNKYREGNVGVVGRDRHSPEYERNQSQLCSEAQSFAAPYRRLLVGRR